MSSPHDGTQDEAPLTDVIVAKTAEEALVIAALLRNAGIPIYVGGSLLQDEFAIAQRTLNLQSIGIQVPSDRIEEARDLLAAAKRDGEANAED